MSSAAFLVCRLPSWFLPVVASGFLRFSEALLVCLCTLCARWPEIWWDVRVMEDTGAKIAQYKGKREIARVHPASPELHLHAAGRDWLSCATSWWNWALYFRLVCKLINECWRLALCWAEDMFPPAKYFVVHPLGHHGNCCWCFITCSGWDCVFVELSSEVLLSWWWVEGVICLLGFGTMWSCLSFPSTAGSWSWRCLHLLGVITCYNSSLKVSSQNWYQKSVIPPGIWAEAKRNNLMFSWETPSSLFSAEFLLSVVSTGNDFFSVLVIKSQSNRRKNFSSSCVLSDDVGD